MITDNLALWILAVTDPHLQEYIVENARVQECTSMTKMCRDMDHRYHKLAEEQDAMLEAFNGRYDMAMTQRIAGNVHNDRRFKCHRRTVGNVCNRETAGDYTRTKDYGCFQVHDRVRGTQVQIMLQNEELQMEIEAQQELGLGWDDSLVEEDKYPVDVNPEDPSNTSGERQEY
jgi:hypothetical protein